MRNPMAKRMAFGGVLAALALVITGFGGLLPVATYIIPVVCCLLLQAVILLCGRKTGLAWYLAVGLLSVFLGADKEAGIIFLFMGHYPLIRRQFSGNRFHWLLKLLFFNLSILIIYGFLMRFFGLEILSENSSTVISWMELLLVVLGNCVFLLLEHLLAVMDKKFNT